MAGRSDVQAITVSDEVAASTTFIAAAARPNTAFTLANTSFASEYAANVSVGSGTLAAQAVLGSNRVRLKGFSIVSGGSAGVINFYNGAPEDGTILFKSRTIGTDNTTVDRTIPEDGVLFENGFVVNYTIGTIDMMTFFYA